MHKKKRTTRFFRYIYLKLIHTNGTPHGIALGFAVGAFIAIFPSFGLGIFLVLLLAWLFKMNKASAVLGLFVFGLGFISPVWWALSFFIGKLFIRMDLSVAAFSQKMQALDLIKSDFPWINMALFKVSAPYLWAYLLGNLILSSAAALLMYFLVLHLVNRHLRRKKKKEIKTLV
jgi:uncharacterized protein